MKLKSAKIKQKDKDSKAGTFAGIILDKLIGTDKIIKVIQSRIPKVKE